MTVELRNFCNFWAILSAVWTLFRRAANSALSSRSELITCSNWVSYSWHREAFSPRLCFPAAALESEGCLPPAFLDYRCPLSARGNNRSGLVSLSIDKHSSRIAKQSWLLGWLLTQANKQLVSKILECQGTWQAALRERGLAPCWAERAHLVCCRLCSWLKRCAVICWPHLALNNVEVDTFIVYERLWRKSSSVFW